MNKPIYNITPPSGATGAVIFDDGTIFWGRGAGAVGRNIGEICFNTSMTGYQEILTDPSYAGQIINFTFPHIGNIGTNNDDMESTSPSSRGCIFKSDISKPSNYRTKSHFDNWLIQQNIIGVSGIDTRQLTRRIRDLGAPNAVIIHAPNGNFNIKGSIDQAAHWSGLEGMDLAKDVSVKQREKWDQTLWQLDSGYGKLEKPIFHVVAVDFGIKRNILRNLATLGCDITIMPANSTADEILGLNPDGIFLSNGPGDPAATGEYAVPMIKSLINSDKPIFGICLGHQMLALAVGAKTNKMHLGHRGANHPIKDLTTGKVEITSQNHGFVVDKDSLPNNVKATHFSLFDGSLAGIKLTGKPVFSVQYHPEASPGPQDSHYLFKRFVDMMKK